MLATGKGPSGAELLGTLSTRRQAADSVQRGRAATRTRTTCILPVPEHGLEGRGTDSSPRAKRLATSTAKRGKATNPAAARGLVIKLKVFQEIYRIKF